MIGFNTLLAFVNALFLGRGGKGLGLFRRALVGDRVCSADPAGVLVSPLLCRTKGVFPPEAMEDLGLTGGDMGERKAGMLPYLALVAGAAVVLWANWFFVLPG